MRKRTTQGHRRQGIATLEFAMCLPLLLILTAAILWLGVSLSGQAAVTIQARNKAWHQRHAGSDRDAFIFPTPVGKESAMVELSINPIPLFKGAPEPASTHYVFGGSWDHHQIQMNRQPSWGVFGQVREGAHSLRELDLQDMTNLAFEFNLDLDAYLQLWSEGTSFDDVWKQKQSEKQHEWEEKVQFWKDLVSGKKLQF